MKSLLFVCLALLFAVVSAVDSDVVVLTDGDFATTTAQGIWLVEFYAPWCGHCKNLAPTWEQLATAVKGKFNVAKVDCTVEKQVASAQAIRGFPTIKLFNNGQVADYQGARTVDGFVSWVEGQTKQQFGVPSAAAPEQPKAEQPKAESGDEVVSPDLVILTDATFKEKTATGTWLVKFYAPWCGHCKRLSPTWSQLATEVKGQFNVAKIDCTVETGSCSDIRGYPTIKLFHNGEASPYNGPRTIEGFSKFVRDTVEPKQAAPTPTPAPTPAAAAVEAETEGEVVILTSDNFEAKTSDGVWFVKFYAPWCGHCKKLAPGWSSYATTVKDKQLPYHVAKVDCTVHKDICQKHGIRGYPTLKLLKGGDTFDYNGAREEPAFLKFVDDYLTVWQKETKQEM